MLLAALALSCVAYMLLGEESFFARNAQYRWYDWLFTAMAPLLVLEFVRRTTGLLIPALMVTAFTYVVLWGQYVPGMLTFPGLSLETMLYRTFYTDDGMLGNIAHHLRDLRVHVRAVRGVPQPVGRRRVHHRRVPRPGQAPGRRPRLRGGDRLGR